MGNMKKLNETELNEVAGGGIFDHPWDGIRAKLTDGSVCSKCGHDVGILEEEQACYMPGCRLFCEKCGEVIGSSFVLFENQFTRV